MCRSRECLHHHLGEKKRRLYEPIKRCKIGGIKKDKIDIIPNLWGSAALHQGTRVKAHCPRMTLKARSQWYLLSLEPSIPSCHMTQQSLDHPTPQISSSPAWEREGENKALLISIEIITLEIPLFLSLTAYWFEVEVSNFGATFTNFNFAKKRKRNPPMLPLRQTSHLLIQKMLMYSRNRSNLKVNR